MSYVVKLSQFEGPLDLLLHLIGNAKINIEDIFVSKITEQYLQYMTQLDELDMESSSEFARMAATLIYIKSKSLLPKKPPEVEEDDNAEELLIAQLREYSAIKHVCVALRELESEGIKSFYRLPEEFVAPPPPLSMEGVTLQTLMDAYVNVLNRAKGEEVVHHLSVKPEMFRVRDKADYLRQLLKTKGSLYFSQVIHGDMSRLEVAVIFLAVLDLLAKGEIKVEQKSFKHELMICA